MLKLKLLIKMITSIALIAAIAISSCLAISLGPCPVVTPGEQIASLQSQQGIWYVQFLSVDIPQMIRPKCLITTLADLEGTNFSYHNSFLNPITGRNQSTHGKVVADPTNLAVSEKIPDAWFLSKEKQLVLAADENMLITTTCLKLPIGHLNVVVSHSRNKNPDSLEMERLLAKTVSFDSTIKPNGGVPGLMKHIKRNRINCR